MLRTSIFCPPLGDPVELGDIVEEIEKTKADLFVGPEYLIHGKTKDVGRDKMILPPVSEDEKWAFIAGLCKATKGSRATVIPGTILWSDGESMYNSAPVIYDGAFRGEVYKRNMASSDATYAELAGQRFATKIGGIDRALDSRMRIGDLSYRISICLDFLQIKKKDRKMSDIHIVMASGVGTPHHTKYTRAKIGGHILYADNYEAPTAREAAHIVAYDETIPQATYRMLDPAMRTTETGVFELDVERRR